MRKTRTIHATRVAGRSTIRSGWKPRSRNEPEASPLADAIKATAENSIFFRTGGKVAPAGVP